MLGQSELKLKNACGLCEKLGKLPPCTGHAKTGGGSDSDENEKNDDPSKTDNGENKWIEGREVKLSDKASFVVRDASDSDMKKITFYYKDENHDQKSVMLGIGTPEVPGPLPEYLMVYDDTKKAWVIEIEKSKNASEKFWIYQAEKVGDPKNQYAPLLQEGFLVMKEGQVLPINSSEVPKGELQTFLLKRTGKLTKVEKPNEKDLKSGERFITIYTPPGYDPDRKEPYPLQVVLDGAQYMNYMRMHDVLDNLSAKNEIDPPVTVFISSCSGPPDEKKPGFSNVMPPGYSLSMRLREYCANPDFADQLAILPKNLKSAFHISLNPKDITIWGVSAGGLCATYTALLHPKVFGNVVAQSPMAWNIPIQNGPKWRKKIVDKKDQKGEDITWTTSTAPLPEKEGEHKEHLTHMVKKRKDKISHRKLASDPVRFYFDAGEKERNYDAKAGSANLVKATELLIDALKKKKHDVIDGQIHLLPGSHFIMTWIRNIPNILKIMHAPKLTLEKEDKHSSTAMIAKKTSIDLSESLVKKKETSVDKNVAVTDLEVQSSTVDQGSHIVLRVS